MTSLEQSIVRIKLSGMGKAIENKLCGMGRPIENVSALRKSRKNSK